MIELLPYLAIFVAIVGLVYKDSMTQRAAKISFVVFLAGIIGSYVMYELKLLSLEWAFCVKVLFLTQHVAILVWSSFQAAPIEQGALSKVYFDKSADTSRVTEMMRQIMDPENKTVYLCPICEAEVAFFPGTPFLGCSNDASHVGYLLNIEMEEDEEVQAWAENKRNRDVKLRSDIEIDWEE